LHYVDDMTHKNKLLEHLLIAPEVNQAIIFTSTKRHADLLAEDLYAAGHKTAALHGDMTQGARNRTLTKLRHGDVKVLVATDVAARGIDVHGITHVINYDLPKFAEDYVHRIGRTGRAGNKGIAISFASNMDRHILRKIEQFTGNKMEPAVVEGFEPKRPMRMDAPGGRGDRRDGHKPGARGGFKPRDDRGGNFGRNENRSHSPRDAAPRFEGNRSEHSRPEGNRNFGDRNSAPANRSFGDSVAFGKKPYARDDQPRAPRSEGNRDNRSARPDAGRNDNRVLGARYEGRADAPRGDRSAPVRREGFKSDSARPARSGNDSRSFGNANAGSGAPRRPRSFV